MLGAVLVLASAVAGGWLVATARDFRALLTTFVLQALARRVDQIELTGEPSPWIHNVLRGFARMPLRLTPLSRTH